MTIAILAGGKSRRFGQDKAALFLPQILDACRPTGLPILVIGRLAHPGIGEEITFLPDDFPDQGPLGGIITALKRTSGPVLVLACDLAFLKTEAIAWLLRSWEQTPDTDILVATQPRENDSPQREPLFAIYSPACLSRAEQLLQEGRRALHQLLQSCQTNAKALPEPLIPQLRNINSPDDYMLPRS